MVANHLAALAGQRAHVTLGRLSATAQAHALLRLPFDLRDSELRKALQGIAQPTERRPAPAASRPAAHRRHH